MEDADEVTLVGGRVIHLRELRQYRTYGGLLEGLPTVDMNARKMRQLVVSNRAQYPRDAAVREPFLIPPVEKPIDYRQDRPYPFGMPSALPAITCIGHFASHEPARGETDYDSSSLMILWYQETFALPIAPDIVAQIAAIDWEQYAVNEED